MAAQVLGIIDAYFKGAHIDCEKGSSFQAGGIINNPVVAGRRLFFSNEWKEGMVEISTVFEAGDTMSSIYDTTPGQLEIKCDTGQQFIWPSVVQTGEPPKVTSGEGGKVALKWAVDEPQELLPS